MQSSRRRQEISVSGMYREGGCEVEEVEATGLE
jgi:hypothetical protein